MSSGPPDDTPKPGQAAADAVREGGKRGHEAGSAPVPSPRNDGVGQVLRDAYRDALDEGVPPDMLDLLRKLD